MQTKCYQILPRVKKLEQNTGNFLLTYETRIVLVGQEFSSCMSMIQRLVSDIEARSGLKPQVLARFEDSKLYLPSYANVIEFSKSERNLHPEAYTLKIQASKIEIQASEKAGFIHAIQTLRQLILRNGLCLPCLNIEDEPRFKHRGFYHDITRGRIPTLDSLKQLAEKMSFYKLNELQLYIEHSYLFSSESEVWRDDTPLEASDIMELEAYCADLGIQLIPSISSFGHLEKLLQTRSFFESCELDIVLDQAPSYVSRMAHHTVNVYDEKIFEHLCQRIDEFAVLCKSKIFNICADETFDLARGKNQDKAQDIGRDRIYMDFIKKLENHLHQRGLEMQFWGDVIAHFPELSSELREESVCLVWDYGPQPKADGSDVLAKTKRAQILCPGVCGWNLKINNNKSAYLNNLRMTEYAEKYEALGLLNTNWGDYAHINDPILALPGLIYGASFAWSSTKIASELSFENMNQEISTYELSDPSGRCLEFAQNLFELDGFSWSSLVKFVEALDLKDEVACAEKQMAALLDCKKRLEFALSEEGQKALTELSTHFVEVCQYQQILHFPNSSANAGYAFKTEAFQKTAYLQALRFTELSNRLGQVLFSLYSVPDFPYALHDSVLKPFSEQVLCDLEYFSRDFEKFWMLNQSRSEILRLITVLFRLCNLIRDRLRSL